MVLEGEQLQLRRADPVPEPARLGDTKAVVPTGLLSSLHSYPALTGGYLSRLRRLSVGGLPSKPRRMCEHMLSSSASTAPSWVI
jgi:hypothetical protein